MTPAPSETHGPGASGSWAGSGSLDGPLGHPERGPEIYGVSKSYDAVERRMARFQTTVTAGIANRQLLDGIGGQIQEPNVWKEAEAYLQATVQASYEQREQARTRLLALLQHRDPKLAYKKRTELRVEMGAQ